MSETLCRWNHQPPAEYEKLPRGVGGWTIAKPFFDDVEGENTLGVDKNGFPYGSMLLRKSQYEAYYTARMEGIKALMEDLDTDLTVLVIVETMESIYNKIGEIDAEYLDAVQDIHDYMDNEDENLYSDYLNYLDSM